MSDEQDQAMDYGSAILAGWQQASAQTWRAYTEHTFVDGLADGTLPKAAFVHYLIQDYVFLVHFSRAWALAVVKAGSIKEMRLAAGMVDALVNHEMQLHVEVCAREGISEAQLFDAKEASQNLAYTRYVVDAGLAGDFLDLLAALSPCVFGYGQIGSRLGVNRISNNPYQDWIDSYAGDDYQQLCVSVASLLESAAQARLGDKPLSSPRWDSLCRRFETATALEVDFWQMGMNAGQAASR